MKEIKTFWYTSKVDVTEPQECEVMVIDGKHELYRNTYSDDSAGDWESIDSTDCIFFEDQEKAIEKCKADKKKALEALHLVHDHCYSIRDIKTDDEKAQEDIKWLKNTMNKEGYESSYWVEEYISHAVLFMQGRAMHSDAVSFTYDKIVSVLCCVDETYEKDFYKVVLTDGRKVKVYGESNMRTLKAVFNLGGSRKFICNGEMKDYINK